MKGLLDLKSKRGILFAVYCLVIILTLAFIFSNSILSKEDSSKQSGFLSSLMKPLLDPFGNLSADQFEHIIRKLAHFSEFALLGFEFALLAFHVSEGFKLRDAVYSAFAGLLCANTDEFLQLFTGRGSMVSDVFIDFCGALCGIAVGYAVALTAKALRKKKKRGPI